MPAKYYHDIEQGTEEWLQLRLGILTASEMKYVITATLKVAKNEKTKTHLYDLLAQRLTKIIEPHYENDDMIRGTIEEIYAKNTYRENFADITDCGFIANDKLGFKLGFSPDGLIGEHGIIECKSRKAKYQVKTIIEDIIPDEYLIQMQTGLLVSERKWCDFLSYSNGLPMFTQRVYADAEIQTAIIEAATIFEEELREKLKLYEGYTANVNKLIPTERYDVCTGDIK